MDAGIIPVKGPERAKRRLGPGFPPAGRAAIARALLDDILELCRSVGEIDWWLVSDDEALLATAAARGLRRVRDRGMGLNEALAVGVGAALDAGATSVVIVPGDLPLVRPADITDLLDTGATSDVVLVPSRDGGGTNGLYLRPPDAIRPAFGPGSLGAHARSAEAAGLRCSILALERMQLDIDTPEDVTALLATGLPSKTSDVAARWLARTSPS